MTKKEIILCDDCKEKVAKHKCLFCDKDLCNECKKTMVIQRFRSRYDNNNLNIPFCEECFKVYDEIELEQEFFNDIGLQIIDYLKKMAILKNLEEKEKDGQTN